MSPEKFERFRQVAAVTAVATVDARMAAEVFRPIMGNAIASLGAMGVYALVSRGAVKGLASGNNQSDA